MLMNSQCGDGSVNPLGVPQAEWNPARSQEKTDSQQTKS